MLIREAVGSKITSARVSQVGTPAADFPSVAVHRHRPDRPHHERYVAGVRLVTMACECGALLGERPA